MKDFKKLPISYPKFWNAKKIQRSKISKSPKIEKFGIFNLKNSQFQIQKMKQEFQKPKSKAEEKEEEEEEEEEEEKGK